MRKFKNILMVCGLLLVFHTMAFAQNKGPRDNMRHKFAHAQFNEVKKALKLDEATANKFESIYNAYLEELAKQAQHEKQRFTKGAIDSLSNEQAEKIIKNRFKRAEKMIAVREKYYDAFKKVLSPKQILVVYQTETKVARKAVKEFHKRIEKRMERRDRKAAKNVN